MIDGSRDGAASPPGVPRWFRAFPHPVRAGAGTPRAGDRPH